MTLGRNNICPECKGKGKKIIKDFPIEYWNDENETKICEIQCSLCLGTGEISDLRLAIYKARGECAPRYMIGYA